MPSTNIDESALITIAAPADLVRGQFRDMDHHASTPPHRGVRFETSTPPTK